MKDIHIKDFKIDSKIDIKDLETKVDLDASEKKIEKALAKVRVKLGELQNTMYAHGKYSILVCFQGMDTAGKDSLIREVFKDFNVRGIDCHSFKSPTELELKHDYLWRHYLRLPARGKFGIFNRTHYENVLVTRVHPNYILGENIPTVTKISDVNDEFWDTRFNEIVNFEKHITNSGTIIFKFFLNLSKDEQRDRLIRRLEKKSKNWKFSADDLKERVLWDNYQSCYEDAINRTSTTNAPWYNIPADDKPSARLIVANILYDTLKEYHDIKEPELDAETESNIEAYTAQLKSE
ncbi:PPK2 family polyphosphate kinase [Formosa sp. PL04]|uniref:PPK2 family polyphosphate kinase n=1 Tax=Formosa sp. PL04 TaxID=3081755 RepID=UPI0029815D84|nr:PPK2 family polyphosphate kinase [Formosa sp. PL04]MDW5290523.1 polyphosphate kinase 2 family protein [Formosa sp. PL04]